MIALYITLGIICGVAAVALFCVFSNECISVKRRSVPFGCEKEVKIAHLSDLHAKCFGKDGARLIKIVAREKPDVIVFTGDIIHKYRRRDLSVAVKHVSALSAVAPVLFVSGNHEMRSVEYRLLRKELIAAGARVLDGGVEEVAHVKFAGVNCADIKRGGYKNLPADDNTVLLAHYPQYFEGYAQSGFPLALCGHAHGGQWRIPFTRIGMYAPGQGLFPKYCCGLYKKDGFIMQVSRGLGNSEFPLRLFNRPEVIFLTLTPKK